METFRGKVNVMRQERELLLVNDELGAVEIPGNVFMVEVDGYLYDTICDFAEKKDLSVDLLVSSVVNQWALAVACEKVGISLEEMLDIGNLCETEEEFIEEIHKRAEAKKKNKNHETEGK